ncbi:hypothetical protein D3C86_1825760 [compost metagenome]
MTGHQGCDLCIERSQQLLTFGIAVFLVPPPKAKHQHPLKCSQHMKIRCRLAEYFAHVFVEELTGLVATEEPGLHGFSHPCGMGLAFGKAEYGFVQQGTLRMADVVNTALAEASTLELLASLLDLRSTKLL